MRIISSVLVAVVVSLMFPGSVAAQAADVPADAWRAVASRVDPGGEVQVRLLNGQRFKATVIEAREDVVLLQPRTRVPVPIQAVRYDAIASLERPRHGGGNTAKAVAIGAGTGVAAFFTTMAIVFALVGD